MSGNPKKRAQMQVLEEAGEDVILALREEGKGVTTICRQFGVGPRALYGWLGREEGEPVAVDEDGRSRRDRWNEATLAGAERLAERPGERYEQLVREDGRMKDDVTREEIALTKAAAEHDVWLAGVLDGKRFDGGLRKAGAGAQVVNINELHLTAVQTIAAAKRAAAVALPPAPPVAEDAEYELITDGEDNDGG